MTEVNLDDVRRQLNALNFIADKMRIVTVSAMDEDALESCTKVEGECFYNSYMNVIYGKGERYVLGYRCEETVIDHAIIRKGDKYYDPTLQAAGDFKEYQYAILTEFKVFDMMTHAKSNKDFPPDVDYLLTKANKFKNVINVEALKK
ncbi:hypothetical protein ACFFLZ_01235 [Photobacterium aphoticum]|uniref:Uncharacterized protein n=1 Tax=Photobacterium aphoticum TaxID=754436 RepID=A0A090QN58_9GAMM|nr:hypothetical protein [Photobacterium aphoticum]KLU99873.1 hypothetical protein ABT58_15520 [Photobacterium aphoticum]PSU59437.1 hypothetical protein C9I90_02880 [Photobacterium aphoticum]GAL03254.1 hypothetical protein JCM19237_6147 [Photobacterium aphoticum]GHA40663.1 hypothetical protein GCM10007086_12850 [Photobacterium aphoticum]